MPSPVVFSESLEPRMLLSAASHVHASADRGHVAAITAKLKHAKHHTRTARHATSSSSSSSAGIGHLSQSGPFSFTFGDFVLSGTIDGGTHAVNATLVGPGVQFDVVGTFDASTGTFTGTITGDRTNVSVDGTLASGSVKGSLNGLLFGNAISFNRTIVL